LEITATKKYPTKKTEPIDRNKHPHNFLSSNEANQRIESPNLHHNQKPQEISENKNMRIKDLSFIL